MKYRLFGVLLFSLVFYLISCENDDSKRKLQPELNKPMVYKKLVNQKGNKSNVDGIVVIKDVTYTLGNNNKILQVEKDFTNSSLDINLDNKLLKKYAQDYMEQDARLKENKSTTEKVFHSKKANKDYYVTYSLNDEGKVKTIIISSFK